VSEDAGIEPRTVATLTLVVTVRGSDPLKDYSTLHTIYIYSTVSAPSLELDPPAPSPPQASVVETDQRQV
jgi:hypothetical protein